MNKLNKIATKTYFRIKDTLTNQRGEVVTWIVLVIVCVIIAVIAFKGLAPGIRAAAQNMSNALIGN